MNWIPLTDDNQLETINKQSFLPGSKGVLVFKHSSRCSISSVALSRLERAFDVPATELPAYFLDILSNRNLSDKIAEVYGIPHQSPQLLIIKNGKCVYTASHFEISFADIQAAISS